jgi:hypothetical protein
MERRGVSYFASSITLTWAATTRQPSGKRTQACGGARGAECSNLVITVENFRAAVADGAGIFAKQFVERGDVVCHQRLLIAFESGGYFGDDLRQVDLHRSLPGQMS